VITDGWLSDTRDSYDAVADSYPISTARLWWNGRTDEPCSRFSPRSSKPAAVDR
jgi:hypothetical protein